ncbi:transposase [Glaciimonas sp. PCH181]|uniref:transposase n=1 Tax=Glaciimonas sp. PCH181 TaxID=2133943 RepID=UPI001374DC73|nr:transposase [Glaciimonas sp. PCH181]
MDTNIESVTPSKRSGYRQHSIDFKRMVVEQSLMAGASVSRVARAHDVNANQVFTWRKLFRAGAYEIASGKSVKLLPVVLGDPRQPSPAKPVFTTLHRPA